MGLLSDIFTGGVAKKGIELVDEAFHTDQEKGEANP